MIGILFPGQGTQKAGMYNLLGEKSKDVDDIFQIASEVSGVDVKDLCQNGSDEELRQTINTQTCVTAMNMAYFKLITDRGISPDIVAGHSLGQFSALAASGVISEYDLFRIVKRRAELMSGINIDGSLATIVGVPLPKIEEICQECSSEDGCVTVALENTSTQIVIGGNSECVIKAADMLRKSGAIKVVEVKVSNAFHTPLMKGMQEPFMDFLGTISFNKPKIKLLLNALGGYSDDPEVIKKDVYLQCTERVKWRKCMEQLLSQPDLQLAESGVGHVLSGMVRSMNRQIHSYYLSDSKEFDLFVKVVNSNMGKKNG